MMNVRMKGRRGGREQDRTRNENEYIEIEKPQDRSSRENGRQGDWEQTYRRTKFSCFVLVIDLIMSQLGEFFTVLTMQK